MIFLGYTFAGGKYSVDPTPATKNDLNSITIENGIYDYLYATEKEFSYSTNAPSEWDFDTRLYAKFNGNLLAGNIDFALSEVTSLRLKRRKNGSMAWVPLYEQPVSTKEDLSITYYDKTSRSNTKYDYTIVPVFGQVEGSFFTNSVTTDYQGLFIVDRDNVFNTELDVTISKKRNKPRNVITPINRKYPFVVSNGLNDFNSGSVSAQWLEYDSETDDWNNNGKYTFVDNLEDFLNNGLPKLIKNQDGRMWLASVSSPEVTESEDENHLQVHTSFDWTEKGDCDSGSDLYTNGFIDVDQ